MHIPCLIQRCVPRVFPEVFSLFKAAYRPNTLVGSTGRVPGATAAPTAEKGDKAPSDGPGAGATLS